MEVVYLLKRKNKNAMNTVEMISALKQRFNDVKQPKKFLKNVEEATHGLMVAVVLNKYPVSVVTFDSEEMVRKEEADYVRLVGFEGEYYEF